ncbi:MAG TPA: HTTM domain-containing protein [Polyangia bacterium]|nr:HTTM domain-containing protein [Polyangia bacterium]
MRSKLRDAYLTIDPRGLGVGRIVLATVLLLDLARRLPFATLWYSNEGLLPNHTVLWRPTVSYVFSLFFTASRPYEAAVGFALCGAAYLMLLVGYKTRWAQVASLLAVLSLHGRVLFIQNSGDVALVELCVWTCFLPLGRRYSLDASRAPVRREPVVSWAVLAIAAQLAVIYAFNAVQKWGPTWREGTAVHYALYYANVVTPIGVWVRDWMTLRQSQVLSWSTRVIEGLLPVLLLTPVARRPARWLAIALVIALHVGFGVFMNLGIFVPAMLAFTPFLVPASDWDRLERLWATSSLGQTIRQLAARVQDDLRRRGLLLPGARAVDEAASEAAVPRRRALARAREAMVLALMAIATCGAIFDNAAATHVRPEVQPEATRAILGYLQMFQIWAMFAPDVPTSDLTVAVDAVTADGRHVDPLNEVLSPGHPFQGTSVPPRLGNNGLASAYFFRLPDNPDYFTALGEWLLKYPERSGRNADRIVSFRVYAVKQDDPPPGVRSRSPAQWHLLFQYPN